VGQRLIEQEFRLPARAGGTGRRQGVADIERHRETRRTRGTGRPAAQHEQQDRSAPDH